MLHFQNKNEYAFEQQEKYSKKAISLTVSFWNMMPLCSPGWLETDCVAQAAFKHAVCYLSLPGMHHCMQPA